MTRAVLALLGAIVSLGAFAQNDGPTLNAPRKTPFAASCESVVVVRCSRPANAQVPAATPPTTLDTAKADLAADRFAIDDESGRVVIYGTAPKSKMQTLREVIQSAAPPVGGMTFRTVPNGDGTQCTCVGPPCVINCCVCSGAR